MKKSFFRAYFRRFGGELVEKTVYMSMLFDFYGELLTDKQKEYFGLYYNENLSLGEIAEIEGISRQGVRDNIVRAETTLTETEEKVGLLKRHTLLLEQIEEAQGYIKQMAALNQTRFKNAVLMDLCNKTYDLLEVMKD
jgi:predicted DNA-binding protein YlxM (UPF0122 family)